jgi:transcriptional regulator with XRE-family HTH domain
MEARPPTYQRTPQQQHDLAQLLRQRRQQLGLSFAQVAARAGISPFVVRQYERGARTVPRRRTLQGLAAALDLALPELIAQAVGQGTCVSGPLGTEP